MYVAFATTGDLVSSKRVVLPTELVPLEIVGVYMIQPMTGEWPLPSRSEIGFRSFNDFVRFELSTSAVVIIEFRETVTVDARSDLMVMSLDDLASAAKWVNGELGSPAATISSLLPCVRRDDTVDVISYRMNTEYLMTVTTLEITAINLDVAWYTDPTGDSDPIAYAFCDMLQSYGSSLSANATGIECFDPIVVVERQKIIDAIIESLGGANLGTIASVDEQMSK